MYLKKNALHDRLRHKARFSTCWLTYYGSCQFFEMYTVGKRQVSNTVCDKRFSNDDKICHLCTVQILILHSSRSLDLKCQAGLAQAYGTKLLFMLQCVQGAALQMKSKSLHKLHGHCRNHYAVGTTLKWMYAWVLLEGKGDASGRWLLIVRSTGSRRISISKEFLVNCKEGI